MNEFKTSAYEGMEDKIVNKSVCAIEHHCLQLEYSHLRIHNQKALEKLLTSMEDYGQLVPVIVVPEEKNTQPSLTPSWTLIDGYLRVKALKRLGKDTVEAEVWHCSLEEALLMVLKSHLSRPSGILEEALFLQELHKERGISQQVLATRVGRDQSWISRRLSLVESLPESILKVLSKGAVSLWIGTRILAPMARAIPEHAERLLTYLLKHTLSCREMQSFYEHYQRSTHQERGRMVDHPDLFFKAKRILEAEKEVKVLKEGPTGQWRGHCQSLMGLLGELRILAPSIFVKGEDSKEDRGEESHQSEESFHQARAKFDELARMIQGMG